MSVKRKLTDFTPDSRNANKGTVRGLAMLEDSLRKYGAGRSILVDKNNRVIAGNKTIESAVDVGLTDAIVVPTDGKQLVVVQRVDVDLDTPQGRELAIADNRTSEVSMSWSAEVLAELASEGVDLAPFFDDDELAALLADVAGEPPADPGARTSEADTLKQKWATERGQIWQLGKHRLAIGDSKDKATVDAVMQGKRAALVVTDPPYGVNYDPEWRGEDLDQTVHGRKIEGDDSFDWLKAFEHIPADVLYVWLASYWLAKVQFGIEAFGFVTRYLIIWNKDLAVFGRGHYHWKHEPCLYMVRTGCTANWQGARDESTVWDIPTIHSFKNGHNSEEWGLVGHANQKPLECMERPIRNNTKAGEIVFDPFVGSGTTLAACERLGRAGRAIEIDPGFAAVTLERLAALGLQPQRERA